MNKITVFAPSTVANVGCGYDIMGFALEKVGDLITIEKNNNAELKIRDILGCEGLPYEPEKNVATVAIKALLDDLNLSNGYDVTIQKKMHPGSGLGSSASSAAGAVFAVNALLEEPLNKEKLIPYAMEGERVASEHAHADNVAPALLGGFTIIRSYDPLDIISIKYPEELKVLIIYPLIEVKTSSAKRILRQQLELKTAIKQWGNVAALTAGLINNDYDLIKKSINDYVAEPYRSILIPLYDEAKKVALDNGALGYNISGSGPSMFSFCQSVEEAEVIESKIKKLYKDHLIDCMSLISPINPRGTEIISQYEVLQH